MAGQKVVTIRLLTFHANNATRGLWARYSLRPAPLRHRNSEAVQTSRVSSLPFVWRHCPVQLVALFSFLRN